MDLVMFFLFTAELKEFDAEFRRASITLRETPFNSF